MKVLVSRRPLLLRLDISLVLCCCLILLGSRECSARTITESSSAIKVEEIHEESAKSSPSGAIHIHQEQKEVDDVKAINEKRVRQVSETHGKSDKESEDIKEKDVTVNRDAKIDKQARHVKVEDHVKELQHKQIQNGEQKDFKRILKRPIRRLKRDSQYINDEKLQISQTLSKSVDKSEISEENKRVDIEGIRRLDIDVEDEDKNENHETVKDSSESIEKPAEISIADSSEQSRSQITENESKISDSIANDALSKKATIAESSITDNTKSADDILQHHTEVVASEVESSIEKSSRAETFSRLQILKAQAIEFQEKIRNNTFLQNLKSQVSEILPDIPKLTEKQFLDLLKAIISKKDIQQSSDINTTALKDSGLNENQIEIIKCAQQLVAPKERQSFFDNMSECIRGLNVINCMRIFIYPIIVENVPETFSQALPNFPIEINVADLLQGNRPKTARQVPVIGFYANPIDPDAIVFDILMEGLIKNPPNNNLISYIDAKNESLSKLVTCNKLQLLQMSEKFLPENARENYSDDMLSCVKRFEYFSCIKYFSWPMIKQYYAALPEFPLTDSFLAALTYPNYPLITYPGYETGFSHLPEIIDSEAPRMAPEIVIMDILKKTLSDSPRIPSLPTPIQFHIITKNQWISPEQIASIHMAEQLLPLNIRSEYVSRTAECLMQFDYYNCMKYGTWPVVRQFNRQLPQFPNFQDLIGQIPEFPGISQFFQYIFQQFQLPLQFQLPQLPQFPDFSNFTLPNFTNFTANFTNLFPFGQQTTTTTPKPTVENPENDPVSQDSKKINTELESKIYKILRDVRDSMGATPLSLPSYTTRKVFLFPLMTEEQSKIFALAEAIVPPIAREPLINNIYFCLNDRNEFSTCAKTIIWPSIRSFVRGLPEFPAEDQNLLFEQKVGINVPFLPFTQNGDNFFIMRELERIFFEGHENAMSYIIRSIQMSSSEDFNIQKLLDILRSIQFNTEDYLKMQPIRYPQTPEFSSYLTETEENIVHAVESIIPDENRPKFYNDMVECIHKNKFSTCSRNVIFPSVYRYFQKALFDPYNTISKKNDFSKINVLDSSRTYPIPQVIETKINTEKQGENFLITTQRKFMPIYPSNPESVIFSMLRKVQLCTTSLPNIPKESIVNSPEFRQAFSVRQSYILLITERILPEQYRKEFLEEMYKCNQRDSFLNCTRDVAFPTIRKAYPDFPAFPEFENDIDRSNMLLIINNLHNQSTLSRSYESRRTLPSLDLLSKFVTEDKKEVLQTLVHKLPDSLYYDLYVKMSQCTQYSDGISCSHDVIYPYLKQYYDTPEFNVDDYYPITAKLPFHSAIPIQSSTFDYEIFCEDMEATCTLTPLGILNTDDFLRSKISPSSPSIPYVPFGKLSDGSRIFKRAQDIWNSDITPSVGADSTTIPEYAGQPLVNNIGFEREPLHSFFPSKQKSTVQNIHTSNVKFLKRNKRNVEDLLDSYPDAIPDDKKISVPRRIPPKLTFPNMTEHELLQILLHISKVKHDRISEKNEEITQSAYFVDFLNETEKALITTKQYEILKLIQDLTPETAKASFMSRVIQCIRSLSFIRCMGIFVWPFIVSNLPSLPFNFPTRDNRASEEIAVQELFGISSSEFETELINRKQQIESTFVEWYKTLTEDKFEMDVGPLRVKGYGNGELGISYSGHREARLSKFKDNKNLPSILTIISEIIEEVFDARPNKTKNKKENLREDKRNRSLREFEDSDFIKLSNNPNEEEISRSVKDDQVINLLLEKLRPAVTDTKDEDVRHYYTLEDAYRAFQVLFGPTVSNRIANQLKSIDSGNIENFDHLKLVPLKVQEENLAEKLKIPRSRAMHAFGNKIGKLNTSKEDTITSEMLSILKANILEYIKTTNLNSSKKKVSTELTLRLPKLNEIIVSRKATGRLSSYGRGKKNKGGNYKSALPAIGIGAALLMQMAIAHAKAAASVAGILSNMALGSAMMSIVRDMITGNSNPPKIKYVYDSHDKHDVPWPPNNIYAPSPHFN